MKRVGFITDNIDIQEPISKILHDFDGHEDIRVETINRLNPELPTINKIQSILDMCDVIVFYISKGSPNIFYEIGLAQGAKKKVIIIADSHNKIPFDLSFQKCIITDGDSFEYVAYEIFRAIEYSSKSNSLTNTLSYDSKFIFESYFNDYAPEVKYRDLYAFSGSKRHKLFEQWFLGLAKNIKQWQIIESDKGSSREAFDFMVWNSGDDPELQSLGNPIPVELKALNSMSFSQWSRLAENIRKQGLRSLLLLTTGKNKRDSAVFASKLKKEHGVLIVALDRDDLIDIESSKDLYLAIKQQLLTIMYRGG